VKENLKKVYWMNGNYGQVLPLSTEGGALRTTRKIEDRDIAFSVEAWDKLQAR
jgi:hypothetical protein